MAHLVVFGHRAGGVLLLAAAVLTVVANRAAWGGDSLSDIRRDVRQVSDDPSPQHDDHDEKHGQGRHDDDDDDDSILGSILGGFINFMIGGEVGHHHHHHSGNHHGGRHPHGHGEYDITYHTERSTAHWQQPQPVVVAQPESYFAKFPYADGLDGYMMQQTWVPARPQTRSTQMMFHYGTDFDRIDRYTGSMLLETTSRWGIDGQWNYFTEKLAGGAVDEMHVGDVNVLWRILETRRLQGRVGAGMNWLSDAGGSDFGFNLTMRSEAYPMAPFIISSEAEWGTIGNTSQFHGAVGLGAAWRRVEFFAGYDYRKIGGTELAGPQFGLRVWY